MQKFRVNSGEAQNLFRQLYQREDDGWKMLVEGEEYDVADGYDMTRPDNRLSLYLKVRKLKEGGHDYKAVLGADTTLDQVSFQREHRDTCNCIIETMWSKGHAEDSHPEYGRQTFPHASHQHCEHHAHMKHDHVAHHHEVHGENWHKNHTVCGLAEKMGLEVDELKWEHRDHKGSRTLFVRHSSLEHPQTRIDCVRHVANCPKASKRPVVLTHED